MRSLLYHVRKRNGLRTDSMPKHVEAQCMSILLSQMKAATFMLPDDFMSFDHFVRVVKDVDMTSSPGYPYMQQFTTNRQFLSADEVGNIPLSRLQYVWDLVSDRINSRDSDPIRLFIKPEPHKRSKMDKEAYRLISSVSIVDQVIDAMLFGSMNDEMVKNWPKLPTRVGWSPFYQGYKSVQRNWLACDKSGWDWSVMPWLVELVIKARKSLCLNPNQIWLDLVDFRYKQLYDHALFILSNGLMVRQKFVGVMKSGCFNTITDNSIMQILLHIRVCLELNIPVSRIVSMGDDTLQELIAELDNYLAQLSQYCHVKDWVQRAEFAGAEFHADGRVEPLYKGKHAFNLLHMDVKLEPDVARSYCLLYHRSKFRLWMRTFFKSLGHEPISLEESDAIWDGEQAI